MTVDYLSIATEALNRVEPDDLSDFSGLSHPAEPYEGALAGYLFPFQQAGVQYIAKARQVLVGDDMGLGKTAQALAALLNDGAAGYTEPVLVLCPPSLTANWQREIENLSDLSVYVAKGLNPTDEEHAEAMGHDVIVAGYSVLRTERVTVDKGGRVSTEIRGQGWARMLRHNIAALVVDESHYLKNYKAQRTEAATLLADSLPTDALRILLTGTPVLNRPNELATQIGLLGRLSDTGFYSSFNWLKHYCNGRQSRWGWDFSGASNISMLNERMRKHFYVRRTKRDAGIGEQIGTTEGKRAPVKVSLDLNGSLAKYNRASDDIIAFAREHGGAKAAWSAARAEVLVRLNALRKLAGEAKVETAVEWVQNWLDSNPEDRIVVFATYKAVQHALVEAFDAPAILGGQSAEVTEAEKARFNDGDARVIVVSLAAGREGHTLLGGGACSDVLFTEQGWTPAEHQQAEDRVNRIGQTEVVTPWYLLGAPIDHALRDLIEAKQVVTDAVANGADAEADEAIAEAAFYRLTA